jgi:hypothetical protein
VDDANGYMDFVHHKAESIQQQQGTHQLLNLI